MTNREVFAECVRLWERYMDVRDNPRNKELQEKWDKYCLGAGKTLTKEEWTEFLSFQDLELKAFKAHSDFMEANK
jgi:hypothetical protein